MTIFLKKKVVHMPNKSQRWFLMKVFSILAMLLLVVLVSGCSQMSRPGDTNPIYNSTLNDELENLTMPGANSTSSANFMVNFTPRAEAEYDFASDDVFGKAGESFDSSKASVLGIMLGDSYEDVIAKLGTPDLSYIPSDRSYRNLEYGKKIGVSSSITAVTYHIEGDEVTRITMRNNFNKYLVGKTKMGTQREEIYAMFNVPDYMSFLENHRVFHYVEKGLEIYLKTDKVDIISLVPPKEFKGVEYRSVPVEIAPGVWGNVTKPFPIE
jgi:hypothetical protein